MCKFCKTDGEFRSDLILFETDLSMILVNLYPIGGLSFLVIPKRHIFSITETTLEELNDLAGLTKKVVKQIKGSYNPDGLNILLNEGEVAGQTIFHVHFHVVARFNGDGVRNFKRPGLPQEVSLGAVNLFRKMMNKKIKE